MQTKAAKRFKRESFRLLGLYFVVYCGSFALYAWQRPTGLLRVMLALVPVLPVLGVIGLMGRYLRDETDAYKRDVTMRCLLWGAAGAVSTSLLDGYLRIFGWDGRMPPFTAFWVFFLCMAAARITYTLRDKSAAEG